MAKGKKAKIEVSIGKQKCKVPSCQTELRSDHVKEHYQKRRLPEVREGDSDDDTIVSLAGDDHSDYDTIVSEGGENRSDDDTMESAMGDALES